ncbi:aspartate kinase [Paracoccus aestuariivivens]|uniref:aspartate kinase n=1 Tax=Paracoccus aestuariivivens TaxID=1820333 RepID=A0A6L6JAJ3_9RHOB|nr:aspartate kinase [Paracoccus aestuariivivens]MTH79132.1 aspartate kinase [Paracoccus aestuariivivens]
MPHTHTVEKIGGTSMSRSKELLDTVLIGPRKGVDLYGRIFVVSAYAGITDALLEHKRSGAPGIFASFASAESGASWQEALDTLHTRMTALNTEIFGDQSLLATANRFAIERIADVRSCLVDLSRLCSFGHFQLDAHLMTVREMLASVGEAHSAFNTVLLLQSRGVNARLVDLSGWNDESADDLSTVLRKAFDGIDLTREMPIVTGYARCREVLMRSYDRGYTEITLARIAAVTGASEAIIHKEFHLSSADPRIVGVDAVRVIGETNYDVADQLSNLGMEAIHPGAAKTLRQAGIPLRVKNAFEPEHDGTVIRSDLVADRSQVEIVTGIRNVFALEFHDPDMVGVKGYDEGILDAMKRHKVWILSKTSNANTITHFVKGSMKAIRRVEDDLSQRFPEAAISLQKVALVSAIGRDLRTASVLSHTMDVLNEVGIEPLGIHDLMRKVDLQVVVQDEDYEAAIIAMHRGLIETPTRVKSTMRAVA